MENFWIYLSIGFNHITDLQGYDHILFLSTIGFIYSYKEWKKFLILVTAFTIGHSITLFLNIFNIIYIPSKLIELLIPITILISIIKVLYSTFIAKTKLQKDWFNYILILFFGLIHGAGFSNYLKAILGKSTNIWDKLLAFNIGLELGQIIILILFLLFSRIVVSLFQIRYKLFLIFISIIIIILSINMIIHRN